MKRNALTARLTINERLTDKHLKGVFMQLGTALWLLPNSVT